MKTRTKWIDKVAEYKNLQYSKKEVFEYIKKKFKDQNKSFTAQHLDEFNRCWKTKINYIPTVDDIIEEVELPRDLTKIAPYQETQVLNTIRRLPKIEVNRRFKLLQIALNVSAAKKNKALNEGLKILSNIFYKSKLIGNDKE
jgi:hypothetical protein